MSQKRKAYWANVTDAQWNDWRWQLKNRITTVEQLSHIIQLDDNLASDITQCLKLFPLAITPHYANLMSTSDPACPIRKQAVPEIAEILPSVSDLDDPLHESIDSPVPGLTHRYPDRVLLVVTNQCATYCRHCTRRRLAGNFEKMISEGNLKMAIDYIRSRKEVRDVLISGGDPLTLPDQTLEGILKALRAIKHVEIIRIGSRAPVVVPQRITKKLCKLLKKFHPLWLNTHFNHPKELVPESIEACHRLVDSGIPVGNQSVLLKGINDCPHVMKDLVHGLVKHRVRPYYIYQCDQSRGISHFRTAVTKGLEIYENLRGHTSGLAIPTFVVDAPGGGGKIPLAPNYIICQTDRKIVLRNYEGKLYTYTEPEDNLSACNCEACSNVNKRVPIGVAGMMQTNKN